MRAMRAKIRDELAVPGRRRQRRLARSAVFRRLRAHRALRHLRAVGRDPAVLQRRHQDAVHDGPDSPLVLDDATQRAIQNGQATLSALRPDRARSSTCASGATSATSTCSRRRPEQIDVKAAFTTTRHTRRAALGRQLRIQQRRRGRAALRLAHERLHARRRVDQQPQHAARGVQRLVVRQSRRHAGLGQPAAARRLDERARAAAAWRCGRRTRRRR